MTFEINDVGDESDFDGNNFSDTITQQSSDRHYLSRMVSSLNQRVEEGVGRHSWLKAESQDLHINIISRAFYKTVRFVFTVSLSVFFIFKTCLEMIDKKNIDLSPQELTTQDNSVLEPENEISALFQDLFFDIPEEKEGELTLYTNTMLVEPEKTLILMAEKLDPRGNLPKIHFIDSSRPHSLSIVSDLGGIGREVLSDCCQHLFLADVTLGYVNVLKEESIEKDVTTFIIYPRSSESEDFFKSLGRLFFASYKDKQISSKKFSLSSDFDSSLLKACALLINSYRKYLENNKKLPLEAIVDLYFIFSKNNFLKESLEEYRKLLPEQDLSMQSKSFLEYFLSDSPEIIDIIKSSKEEVLGAIERQVIVRLEENLERPYLKMIEGAFWIAQGMIQQEKKMNGECSDFVCEKALESHVRGNLSVQEIQKKLTSSCLQKTSLHERLMSWLYQKSLIKIRSEGYTPLERFLKCVTGSHVVTPQMKFKIIMQEDSFPFFKFHTCFNQIDVPKQEYLESQEAFNMCLDKSVEYALNGHFGYQIL